MGPGPKILTEGASPAKKKQRPAVSPLWSSELVSLGS